MIFLYIWIGLTIINYLIMRERIKDDIKLCDELGNNSKVEGVLTCLFITIVPAIGTIVCFAILCETIKDRLEEKDVNGIARVLFIIPKSKKRTGLNASVLFFYLINDSRRILRLRIERPLELYYYLLFLPPPNRVLIYPIVPRLLRLGQSNTWNLDT